MTGHGLKLVRDGHDWHYAKCDCGWVSPPCPDDETAADSWADHIVDYPQ